MNEDNSNYLLKSLDNENNSSMNNLTSNKIKSMKNDYLQQLQLFLHESILLPRRYMIFRIF